MRERFKTGTARTIGFAFVAMAGLSASAARADTIFGASAIFTDRSCAQAADVACQFDAVRGPKLTSNQFFGGYGYILEYPVARAYADARVQRIYAGTNEIMRIIIGRSLGL